MSAPSPAPRLRSAGGCASLLCTGLATCVLVVANGITVSLSLPYLARLLPRWLLQPKVLQSLMFLLPVLLTIAQWWLIDLLIDLKRARQARQSNP